jgi:glycosyltransferase involved in cell wall biosynthesis
VRVVLLNQYYAPDEAATAQLLADVGAGLCKRGHEVVAVCSRRSYADPDRTYPARDTIDGVEIRRAWATGFGRASKLGRVLDYGTFLLGAARLMLFQRRPDVVVSLSTPPLVALLGWLAARLRGARTIYWVMDVYPDVAYELEVIRRGSLVGRLLGRVSRFLLRRSDRVVALGETMAARLQAQAQSDIEVVHNWADEDVIRPRALRQHPLRQRWGWDGRFVVLYSGNMGLAHEFETVLAAAERLRDDPGILFAFVGGGPRRRRVEAEVGRRGLGNVEFRPYVARSDLGDSLTAADAHLVTLRPGCPGLLVPSKIYGILAAGRPTLYVGPSEGEIWEIVSTGTCGACLPCGADERLARAIRAYRDETARCEADGRRARELFEARFTKERGVREFVGIVEGVAA